MKRCLMMIAGGAALLLAAAWPVAARAGEWRMTLEQSVQRALEENRDIATARARLAELDGMKNEARSIGLPQVIAGGSYQRTWRKPQYIINDQPYSAGTYNTYMTGAQVSQLLFDGGRVFKAVKAARAEEARGIQTIRDAEREVRFEVKQTFFQILYTEKIVEVLERELAQLKMHLASIQARFRQGLDSDYTLMRQQVAVSNVEPQLIEAKRQRALLANALKILLVIPPEEDFFPEGGFDPRVKEKPVHAELVEMARATRPDLAAERLRAKSLALNIGVEKSAYWPQLSISSAWQWQAFSDDWRISSTERTNSFNSAATLSWPIFEGLKTHARVAQAQAKLLQQHYLASRLEDVVVKDVEDALESLARARQALETQQKTLALAKRATAIASERFTAGLTSQLELNDAITSQAKAEELFLQSALECLTAEASLEKAVGGEL